VSRLLDTNVCIDVLRGRKKVTEQLAKHQARECFISVITEFELFQGALRAPEDRRDEERAKVARFAACLQIVPFDSECARLAGKLNADLLNRGTPVSLTDVFIAATALRNGWTMVTNNTRDFKRFEGLVLEDWR